LSTEDTDGIELRFGNTDGMLAMIRKIAFREGFGAVLAEGVKRAAEKIGNGAEQYALHVKGQELPMHDPRGKHGLVLSYAISPTGADHIEAPHDTAFLSEESPMLYALNPAGVVEPISALDLSPGKIRHFVHTQQIWSFFNSAGICNFAAAPYSGLTLPLIKETVEAVTGWSTSLYELMELGERSSTMARVFNVREGLTPEDDNLPDRLYEVLEEGTPGEKRISREDVGAALRNYYGAMGWDPQTGVPTEGRLGFLGLEWLSG
jgi:aldehyde:ferredoxin oxidoreductase